jgi:hypothetical protein
VAINRAAGGQGFLGGLQQQHHAGEALAEGVVDVAGQPLTLLEHAGVALRGGQLRAGRLELLQ